MKSISMVALLAATAAFAQQPPTPDVSALKTYLSLTDSQITALQAIQKQQRTGVSDLHQQVQQKQQALNALLSGGSTDANAVGKLVLDIQALRKQIDTNASSFRAQAANVLTADQKTKLKTLDDASKLQPAISEAVFLLLLAPPTPAQGGLLGPGGMGGFGVFGGPGGPRFGGRAGGPAMFGRPPM
jgi:Spy/CpxP family protein refolding chaperone